MDSRIPRGRDYFLASFTRQERRQDDADLADGMFRLRLAQINQEGLSDDGEEVHRQHNNTPDYLGQPAQRIVDQFKFLRCSGDLTPKKDQRCHQLVSRAEWINASGQSATRTLNLWDRLRGLVETRRSADRIIRHCKSQTASLKRAVEVAGGPVVQWYSLRQQFAHWVPCSLDPGVGLHGVEAVNAKEMSRIVEAELEKAKAAMEQNEYGIWQATAEKTEAARDLEKLGRRIIKPYWDRRSRENFRENYESASLRPYALTAISARRHREL